MIKFVIEGFGEWKSECVRKETEMWKKHLDSIGIICYIIIKERDGRYYMINSKWFMDNKFDVLAEEARNQGCVVRSEKYIPFDGAKLNFFDDDDIVLAQTSINLALQIKKETNWKPGPWLTVDNYECVKYYPILKEAGLPLFNGDCLFETRANVEKNMPSILKEYGEDKTNRIFIRPSSGLKPFTGMVFMYREPYWNQDWFWVRMGCKEDDILLIAKPSWYDIIAEWRFIASEGEIISGSQYKRDYESEYVAKWEDEAFELAADTAMVYQPDPMYTVDICQTSDYKFHVMELNSFSCAGLYGCDLKPVVERALQIVRRDYGNEM